MKPTSDRPPRYSKSTLPSKPCVICGRPFAWRRKWARDWETVKHCSDACRKRKRAPSPTPS
ncbi:MAG TPA: DUF2256 domain-containing protein [Patescibacteria group bacterium]|nr:DUF2256 domain-containing protein [Patescibacteria group bacterium]